MELFFDINVKKNTYWGEIPPFPTDMVSDEAPLVQELYKLLFEHKKQKDEAIKKQVEQITRNFQFDGVPNSNLTKECNCMKKVINTLLVFAVIIPFVLLFCSLVY